MSIHSERLNQRPKNKNLEGDLRGYGEVSIQKEPVKQIKIEHIIKSTKNNEETSGFWTEDFGR